MAKARDISAVVDIKIRMREPLRSNIERAAETKGISMNAEMVERLGRSFDAERALDEAMVMAYGPTLAVALTAIGRAVLRISRFAPFPQSWADRPDLGEEMGRVSGVIFGAFQGRKTQVDLLSPAADIVGELMYAIKYPERAAPELRQWAQPLHEKLGPEGVTRLRVLPWCRPRIGADGTLIGADLIDGDTVTDLKLTNLPVGETMVGQTMVTVRVAGKTPITPAVNPKRRGARPRSKSSGR